MKANFGKNNKKSTNKHDVYTGGFETMMKQRKEKLPELEEAINEMLEDYDGGAICIVRIKEDENGDAEGHQLFVGGVSKLEAQMSLGVALEKTSDDIRQKLIDAIKEDPSVAGSLLQSLLGKD